MLTNIPSAEGLDEVALRLHFAAWKRSISLFSNFAEVYDIAGLPSVEDSIFKDEWKDYIKHAQPEISTICTTIQHSAELRLKSIICETSPFLLLLNSNAQFKKQDVDFSELRTLDAVDLPDAVRSLTKFALPASYLGEYGKMRRLRNKVIHLGLHQSMITPDEVIDILNKQYIALWPDGRWLYRRAHFDGNSARNFFHDNRYSSTESNVMAELPFTIALMDNATFKKSLGVPKGKLKGFCPICMDARATKWDATGHATAYHTGKGEAHCAMCEQDSVLSAETTPCDSCSAKTSAHIDKFDTVCFGCGE
jgi:hypothetical protein